MTLFLILFLIGVLGLVLNGKYIMYFSIILLFLLGLIVVSFFGRKVGFSGSQVITCYLVFRWIKSWNVYIFFGLLVLTSMRIFYSFMFNALDLKYLIIFTSPIFYIITRYILWDICNNRKDYFFSLSLIKSILLIISLIVLSLFFFNYLGIVVTFIILDVALLLKNINEIFHVKDYVMLGVEESFLADKLSAKNTTFFSDKNVESSSSNTGSVSGNTGNIASASSSTNRYVNIAPRPTEQEPRPIDNRMAVSSVLNPEPVITRISYQLNLYNDTANQQEAINSLPRSYSRFTDYDSKCREIIYYSDMDIKSFRAISRTLNDLRKNVPGFRTEIRGNEVHFTIPDANRHNLERVRYLMERQNNLPSLGHRCAQLEALKTSGDHLDQRRAENLSREMSRTQETLRNNIRLNSNLWKNR